MIVKSEGVLDALCRIHLYTDFMANRLSTLPMHAIIVLNVILGAFYLRRTFYEQNLPHFYRRHADDDNDLSHFLHPLLQ